MSLTAGPRLSGLRGSAPQISEVHPIFRLRVAAEPIAAGPPHQDR